MSAVSAPVPGPATDAPARSSATVDQAGERRAASIEALRALAALAVLVCHVFVLTRGLYGPSYVHRAIVVGGGTLGVYLFFVLTGFLLYRPFARAAFADGPAIDVKGYAINRALRILPLYYAVLLVVVLVDGHPFDQALRFALFAQNFSTADVAQTVDPPMWSLVVEVQFYIVLPLIALGIAAASRGNPLRAGAILLITGVASGWASAVDPTTHGVWFHSFPACWQLFAAGMLLALVHARLDADPSPRELPAFARGDLLVAAGIVIWLLISLDERYGLLPLSTVTCMAIVGAVVLPLRPGVFARLLGWRPLALLGVASYSLYLWHYPLLWWIGVDKPAFDGVGGFAKGLAIGVPACIAVAIVSYRLLEAPPLRWRRPWFRTALDAPQRAGGSPTR
jgi:peptidoglycan/LPS O-acetylase OafA/YrhL